MIVCGRELSQPVLERIQTAARELSPRKLAAQLCQWLDWKGPGGRFQVSVAVGVVRRLHKLGVICLAKSQAALPLSRRRDQQQESGASPETPKATEAASGSGHGPAAQSAFGTEGPVAASPAPGQESGPSAPAAPAPSIPQPALVGGGEPTGPVELVVVGSRFSGQYHRWRQLMDQHHYLGSGPLAGHQLRYLIRVGGAWVGGLAFSAAALRVQARDRWIGWSEEARRENLPYVINNSRFLLLPQVSRNGLASQVLQAALGRVVQDWQEQFGYRPLLAETFVEVARYSGVCYEAAGWKLIGLTQGRGRQDGDRSAHLPRKRMLVRPLAEGFREQLCAEPVQRRLAPKPRPEPPPPVAPADWAEAEFGGSDLGDKRLNERLLTISRDFFAHPTMDIPQACGNKAKVKAAYRFFDHPRVNLASVLAGHYAATAERARSEKIILAVQDTTELNYSAHPKTELLGPICDKARTIGMLMHETMAYNAQGTALGLIDAQCWTRDPDQPDKAQQRYELAIEQKESFKWVVSWRAAVRLREQCPDSTVISVGDREADVYELLAEAKKEEGGAKLLVRATQDRKVQDPEGAELAGIGEWMAQRPADGGLRVDLPRTAKRLARRAKLEVRYAEVELRPPKRKPHLGPVKVWAVTAVEVGAPAGQEPVEWKLLTTVEVKSFAQALEVIEWYTQRFQIEVFHRTLKSGCRIEDRQLGNAEGLEGCLAVDLVVAWRIVHLTKLGREVPEVPCTVFFEEAQWKALVVFATENPQVPDHPPTLREAIRMMAMSLGGFLGREGDGEPGAETIWRGLQRLDDITRMWMVLTERRSWRSPTERELDSS